MLRVPSLQRLLLLLLLAAFGAGAAFSLLEAAAASRWVTLAARIELARERPELPPAYEETLLQRLGPEGTLRCNYRRSRAAVTAALFLFQEALRRNDSEERRAQAASVADRVGRFALDCSPADGNVWLAMAGLERSLGAGIQRQRELVVASVRAAPAEGRTLVARARFIATYLVSPNTPDRQGALIDDLRRAVAILPPSEVNPLLDALRASGNPVLTEALLAELPPARLAELDNARQGRTGGPSLRDIMRENLTIDPFAKVQR